MSNDPRAKAFKEATAPKPVKLPAENSNASLNEIKRTLKQKEKMRRCQYYLCDHCDQPIYKPEEGFVVHGNIYVADPNCRGGLVGNNFPEVKPGEKIEVTDVQETVYCKRCFIQAVGLFEPTVRSEVNTDGLKRDGDFKGILKNLGVPDSCATGRDTPRRPGAARRPSNRGTASLDTDDFFRELEGMGEQA
jgi:hypothetical protein